jgi:hypothetical protein
VLLTAAATIEAVDQNSRRIAATMNSAPRDEYYLASNNTDSAQNIGTHTLMAKDSVAEAKLPLRTQADRFARDAVAVVIKLLAKRVKQSGRVQDYVDWGEFLRRLLCHPAQAPGDWAKKMMPNVEGPLPPRLFEPRLVTREQAEASQREGAKQTSSFIESYHALYTKTRAAWLKETKG